MNQRTDLTAMTREHATMDDRIRPRWLLAVLMAAVLAVTAMTGCAAGGGESSPSSATTNPGYAPEAKPPTQSTNDIQQRTDLHNEHVSSWSRYEVVSDHSVRVFFYMSDPQCHGVRAAVDEDATTVRITLYEGTLPDAPAECTTLAASTSLLITTREPVGTRSVISGNFTIPSAKIFSCNRSRTIAWVPCVHAVADNLMLIGMHTLA
ncbi:hypothetical protein BCAL_2151 [Bifidobacterium callitrichos DSM 23973]|uniref:Uncharacterized protein n=1 Tax=Bifidobacterium callitrichos DSM 23973 TaxID=1437609 RepID=A0A086ZWH2_9BIFI|nr:hypothetical protein BCAL_2151 [Bifidobacterium callitrichos DSM 23973]